jgi:hypothetical protein
VSACVHGCNLPRRHLKTCPVPQRETGTWQAAELDDAERDFLCDGDAHLERGNTATRRQVYIGRYGGLETWHSCPGCLPAPAEHGVLCTHCHTQLARKFAGEAHGRAWRPALGSLAWAYDEIAPDLEPGQSTSSTGKINSGKRTPPAAANLHIVHLRSQIAMRLGQWLRHVTEQFNLTGPDWWASRSDNRPLVASSWRSHRPSTYAEVVDAQRFLQTWLGQAETVDDLARMMYREAEQLILQVAAAAPWQARARRIRGFGCPNCDREALVRYEGDQHLTCRRCKDTVDRDEYDRWTELLNYEKAVA